MANRGRPPRAGERATGRVEIRFTLDELRALRQLAASEGRTLADMLRLAALGMAADRGDDSPVIVTGNKSAGASR
jgi:uncharacterized protein (DUF1778 family)